MRGRLNGVVQKICPALMHIRGILEVTLNNDSSIYKEIATCISRFLSCVAFGSWVATIGEWLEGGGRCSCEYMTFWARGK